MRQLKFLSLITSWFIGTLLPFGVPVAQAAPKVLVEDFLIKSATPGIELFVRNKRPAGLSKFTPERTVLYVHGATLASELVFDLPVGGISWADDLARNGWDVWLVDVRGYGRSTWPAALQEPAENNPPVATTQDAVSDFGSAVDFIRDRRHIDSLQLIGWSWGAVIAGSYAAANPKQVSSLVLVSPLWAYESAVIANPPQKAWQEWNLADAQGRIQKGVPAEQANRILPPETLALWHKAVRDSQPEAAKRTPELFRSPTGVLHDPSWRAQAPYDAAAIEAPTLIIRGEWDELTPLKLAQNLFAQLKNAQVRELVELPQLSHFLLVEANRNSLFKEVRGFLSSH
jgi:pimeloyl-ACP methyl ester carboxylesterase